MKLVRDNIPELATANSHPGTFHQAATEAEYALWLRAKLLEEAQEAATAAPADLVEELGDVLQVLYAPSRAGRLDRGRDRVRPRPQGPHPRHLHPPPALAAAT
jgi:predicted house-cleaning noncanonical NTP pyrophosphatase (MazG superfamily)